MYYEIHDRDFAAIAQSPAIMDLHGRYRAGRATGKLPLAAAMPLTAFPEHRDHLMLLEPQAGGGWLYSHYGAGIAAAAGIDMTGKLLSAFEGPVGAFFKLVYERARDERRPLYTIHRALIARAVHTWERLVMPLDFGAGEIGFLVYNRPRVFQHDFLSAMLDVLPDPIMALRAIRSPEGEVVEAELLSANGAALEQLGLCPEAVDNVPVRAGLEACGGEVWQAFIDAVMKRQRTRKDIVCICTQTAQHMAIDVSPLQDGAVIRLNDVTSITNINIALEFERQRLKSELSSHQVEAGRLRAEAVIDPLTGLLNRRGFDVQAQKLLEQGGPLAAITCDIDRFKTVNDRYGHACGDKVLRHVARALSRNVLDQKGLAARWGGEEFVGLLPVSGPEAWLCVEMLRAEIALRSINTPIGPLAVTCSFGIADVRQHADLARALAAADAALYRAKAAGRNRSCIEQKTAVEWRTA
jgi:diguanylate cyclase (GGDEF)-like protein